MAAIESSLRLRQYQHEMFLRSLQGNVIVHMDTGSGKTHVALLRIDFELGRCHPDQVVWFLTPTVELCRQQEQAIRTHLPAVKTRLLTGAENVECWSEQRVWDAALDKVQVVVSTHAVLADALRHGFVILDKLALIVFDEAHHCTKRHPANVIMQDFYHRMKREAEGKMLPKILGLSASLIIKSKLSTLSTLEANLDAVSITPRIYRQELLKHVHRPECIRLEYPAIAQSPRGKAFTALCQIEASVRQDSIVSQKTLTIESTVDVDPLVITITAFCKKSGYLHEVLGQWASEYYILDSIAILRETALENAELYPGVDLGVSRRRLLRTLDHPDLEPSQRSHLLLNDRSVSTKAQVLLGFLSSVKKSDLNGIIFVEQRVTTTVMCKMLSHHPLTAANLRCASFVGASSSSHRRYGLSELVDLKAQRMNLAKFRSGAINMMVSTNALEEGIDVQACNLVVCFDPPPNLKSFIQRRGRARRNDSSWCIMAPKDDDTSRIRQWQALETELERICQQDRKEQGPIAIIEGLDEVVSGMLRSRTTTAMLTPDATLQHLHHFCQQLPHEPYVNRQPQFSYTEDQNGEIRGIVTLPSCINASIRETRSERAWRTERAASKDVAFQAYCRLYQSGLLNENLLPLTDNTDVIDERKIITVGSIQQVQPQYDVWSEMATESQTRTLCRSTISIQASEQSSSNEVEVELLTPGPLPMSPSLTVYWTREESFKISIKPLASTRAVDENELACLRAMTLFLQGAARRDQKSGQDHDILTFLVAHTPGQHPTQWLEDYKGSDSAQTLYEQGIMPRGFIRVPAPYSPTYQFARWLVHSPPGDAQIECNPLRKRRRYGVPFPPSHSIRPEERGQGAGSIKSERIAVSECQVDRLPLSYTRLGLFLPDVFEHIEDFATAEALHRNVLSPLPIDDLQLLVTAITAPCANRRTDYQKLEFVGDTVLKYLVTAHLYTNFPSWHEGFLTTRKASLVSNESLANAALAKGIDRYIISNQPHNRSWRLPSLSKLRKPLTPRTLPLKTLADVVEALIGATYQAQNCLASACQCLNIFMPTISVRPAPYPQPPIFDETPSQSVLEVESLVGRVFTNRNLLLEALTHGSWPVCTSQAESYQRLEFLGDAVLDLLVVRRLAGEHSMRQGEMTQVRAAVVNAELLGFFCLGVCDSVEEAVVVPLGKDKFGEGTQARSRVLWKYIRHDSKDLGAALASLAVRYYEQRAIIDEVMHQSTRYPWEELSRLGTEKVLSDLIESIIGAILVDTDGDLDACEQFLRKIRLSDYLDHVIANRILVEHPKSLLQRHAGSRTVSYTTEHEGDCFSCCVQIDGEVLGFVDSCQSRTEAINTAARQVIGRLEAERHSSTGRVEEL